MIKVIRETLAQQVHRENKAFKVSVVSRVKRVKKVTKVIPARLVVRAIRATRERKATRASRVSKVRLETLVFTLVAVKCLPIVMCRLTLVASLLSYRP